MVLRKGEIEIRNDHFIVTSQVSATRGVPYAVVDYIEKYIDRRGYLISGFNIRKFNNSDGYGDYDLQISIEKLETVSSEWTNSCDCRIMNLKFPVHVTMNGKVNFGDWSHPDQNLGEPMFSGEIEFWCDGEKEVANMVDLLPGEGTTSESHDAQYEVLNVLAEVVKEVFITETMSSYPW